jgi:hypothetical protein
LPFTRCSRRVVHQLCLFISPKHDCPAIITVAVSEMLQLENRILLGQDLVVRSYSQLLTNYLVSKTSTMLVTDFRNRFENRTVNWMSNIITSISLIINVSSRGNFVLDEYIDRGSAFIDSVLFYSQITTSMHDRRLSMFEVRCNTMLLGRLRSERERGLIGRLTT